MTLNGFVQGLTSWTNFLNYAIDTVKYPLAASGSLEKQSNRFSRTPYTHQLQKQKLDITSGSANQNKLETSRYETSPMKDADPRSQMCPFKGVQLQGGEVRLIVGAQVL